MPHRGGTVSRRGSLWCVPRAADEEVAVWHEGFRWRGDPELRDHSSLTAGLCSAGRTTRLPYGLLLSSLPLTGRHYLPLRRECIQRT